MSQSRFITPTLQSNFNYIINEFLQRRANGYIYEAWKVLPLMYRILPPKLYKKKEVKKQYKEIVIFLERNNGDGKSNFMDQRRDTQTVLNYLDIHIDDFFRTMYGQLYDGGYLEKTSGNIGHGSE